MALLAVGDGINIFQGDLLFAGKDSQLHVDMPGKNGACAVIGFYRTRGRGRTKTALWHVRERTYCKFLKLNLL